MSECEQCGATNVLKRVRYADGYHTFCLNCRHERARKKGNKRHSINKQQVIEQQGGVCADCGNNTGLEIHHIVPLSLGGTNANENVKAVCRNCHKKNHRTSTNEQAAN